MSDLLAELKRLADRMPSPPPTRRLEVGPGVLAALKASAPAPTPWWSPAMAALTGIPVMEPEGMTPGAWRLLDSDGAVICEGTL